uniref:Uncharacterized protein LOC111105463 isoform X2 n=1 Tax=Crassostrea virginica TaxID=6565 RepID=A0A8B8AYT7_CRAVI|nr:uncharacterized protein LOC111105463 isoform X2 [Crassostrea virginica]
MFEKQNGLVEFANIYCSGNLGMDLTLCLGAPVNKQHTYCLGLRFANEFSLLFDSEVSYGRNTDVNDLYHLLSLEFYGTEEQYKRILNIICRFELEADNVELFCRFVDSSVTDETSLDDKKKILNTNVERVRNQTKSSADCELYALSSVFHVDIIIDKTGNENWETYMSVVCTYAGCFDSPIILQRKQVRTPCCPSDGRRHNHQHMKHLQDVRTFWPTCIEYKMPTDDISVVIERLDDEDRRLDQINGGKGSLAKAMAKELHGDENQCLTRDILNAIGGDELDLDTKLLNLSIWLKVPIYVFWSVASVPSENNRLYFWTHYTPDKSLPTTKSDCRFYVTLFHNGPQSSFDRIVPKKGCNCQIPPPLSLLRNSYNIERHYLKCVAPEERHNFLLRFLTDAPETDMFEIEFRNFPICSAYSSVNIAEQRVDMKKRTVDCVEDTRYSLLRCLSKEIFGSGNHFDMLLKELTNELMQNMEQYLPFIGDDIKEAFKDTNGEIEQNKKGYVKLSKFIKQRIEDELPCDELLLWLACTFFQTPIFVLRITDTKTSTESLFLKYD